MFYYTAKPQLHVPIYTLNMFYTANLCGKSKVAGRGICEKDANQEEPLSDFRDSLV